MRIIHVHFSREYGEIETQKEEIIKNLESDNLIQYLVVKQGISFGNGLRGTSINKRFVMNSFSGHGNFTDADVIHAHDAQSLAWSYRHSKRHNIPFILTWREMRLPNKGEIKFLKHASMILAISRAIQKRLDTLELTRVKVVPDCYIPLPKPDGIEVTRLRAEFKEAFVVGCACDIKDRVYGIRYLLDAARELRREIPALSFVFIGDGEDLEALKNETKDMENIYWVADVQKLPAYLSIMNAFCYPTLQEPFGNILLKVIQYQVPIIATQVGGIVDILQNRTSALLVPPRRPGLIADSLRTVYREVGIRNSLAREAFANMKNFTPQRIAGMHEVVYRYIASQKNQKGNFN